MSRTIPPFRRRRSRFAGLGRDLRFAALVFFGVLALGLFAISQVRQPRSADAGATTPATRFYVIDGDTIADDLAGVHIRIANIDTPEIHEPGCAAEAALGYRAKAMTQSILRRAQNVEVRPIGRHDRYGRELALIRADGRDLGDSLVAARLARTWEGRRRPWCRADGSVRL
jgi:endonuclease YncB( thermonuclease family)